MHITLKDYLQTGMVFLGATLFFSLVVLIGPWTDIQEHILEVPNIVSGKRWLPNFLFFVVVYVVALGQTTTAFLFGSGVLVLGGAIAAKFAIIRHFLKDSLPHGIWAALTSLFLLLAFTFPGPDHFYLGQIAPNVWHNSTTIFLMPVAILLFWHTKSYLEAPNPKILLPIGLLILLNLLIKPSFFFTLGVVFPALCLLRYPFQKAFFLSLIPVFIGGIIVLLQYYLIFEWGPSTGNQVDSGLKFAPFHVWRHYSSNMLLSLLASLAFPIGYLVLNGKEAIADMGIRYAWALFLFGLLIFIFVSETGEREFHGNFGWQNIICSFMIFWMTLRHYLTNVSKLEKRSLKDWIPGIIFLLHVCTGVVYLCRMLVLKTYF